MALSIKMIWAQAHNRVIGKDGTMPWHLPEDLAHFKRCTEGHTVLMGRKTWESLPERFRPLPKRTNLVLTRQTDWSAKGATVVHSIEQALEHAHHAAAATDNNELWIMGGGQLYAQGMKLAHHLEVTFIDLPAEGDAFAPEIDSDVWQKHCGHTLTSSTGLSYRFCQFTKAPIT